jgi:hypothetical protein
VASGRTRNPFVSNWHIDAVEHLEAVSRGQIRNLLINEMRLTSLEPFARSFVLGIQLGGRSLPRCWQQRS